MNKTYGISGFGQIDVLYVNQNYLKTLPINLKSPSHKKVFLVPVQYKNKAIEKLVKQLYFSQLSYEEQQKTTVEHLPIAISYYQNTIKTFNYNDTKAEIISNPIIGILSNKLLFEEAAYLSNTGLSNPLKIPRTHHSQKVANQIFTKYDPETTIKLSTLHDIQQNMLDSLISGRNNFLFLVGILVFLNSVISYFLIVALFLTRKQELLTMKFLGWRLINRYLFLLSIVASIQIVAFICLFIAKAQLSVLLLYCFYITIDLFLIILMVYSYESKNLVLLLKKGEL